MMAGPSGEIDEFGVDHPAADELIGYVMGEQSQRRAEGIRVHTAGCVECGDRLAALILLREERLIAGDVAAPQATVTPFPVPAKAPVRRAAAAAAAAAAMLILALAWFSWPGQIAERQPLAVAGPPSSFEFRTVDGDVDRVRLAVEVFRMRFDHGTRAMADGEARDRTSIAEALQAVSSGDLTAARTLLEPYAARWDRYGTALLGYVLFLLEDPTAYPVLEMYVAAHPTQEWEAAAESPEDLAFFFAARLRHAIGDDAGAREAVGWIDPRAGAGSAAVAWLRETLGDDARDFAPDIQP